MREEYRERRGRLIDLRREYIKESEREKGVRSKRQKEERGWMRERERERERGEEKEERGEDGWREADAGRGKDVRWGNHIWTEMRTAPTRSYNINTLQITVPDFCCTLCAPSTTCARPSALF